MLPDGGGVGPDRGGSVLPDREEMSLWRSLSLFLKKGKNIFWGFRIYILYSGGFLIKYGLFICLSMENQANP